MNVIKHPTLKNVFVSESGVVFEELSYLYAVTKYPVCIKSNIHIDRYGYEIVSFKKETCLANSFLKGRKAKAHRLIAATYLPDYSEDLFVDHKDRVYRHNHKDNLRMVNRTVSNGENRNTNIQITPIEKRYEILYLRQQGLSVKEISKLTGVKTNTVAEGVRPTSRIWKKERAEVIERQLIS